MFFFHFVCFPEFYKRLKKKSRKKAKMFDLQNFWQKFLHKIFSPRNVYIYVVSWISIYIRTHTLSIFHDIGFVCWKMPKLQYFYLSKFRRVWSIFLLWCSGIIGMFILFFWPINCLKIINVTFSGHQKVIMCMWFSKNEKKQANVR